MENISWKAPEFDQPDRNPNWFVSLWIFAVAFVVVGIIIKSYLFSVFIILAAGIINIYALRIPQEIDFEIGEEHIKIGEKKYGIESFDSFWILEKAGGNVLNLKHKKSFMPALQIPLGDADPEDTRRILGLKISESEQKESLIDLIADWLKF